MVAKRCSKIYLKATCLLVLLSLAACSFAPIEATPTIATSITPAILPTISPTIARPTEDTSGLSEVEIATLSSLEKLDDYPLYVMNYAGGYQYPTLTGASLPAGSTIACSLFASLGEAGDMLYGRNFDWDFSPALLLFTDPPDGYASVSMVNLDFLRITSDDVLRLTDLPLSERTTLLSAPAMPLDGMNEYGLSIALAAVPEAFRDDASYDPSLPTIDSLGIIRQLLDHARNVDEAVQLFGEYNIDFTGGPPLHYLLADRTGKAVLIEFYQGKMVVLPNQAPYHLATNHMRFNAQGDGGCWRYRTMSEMLASLDGHLEVASAMQLLSAVQQGSTQWSSLYDMTNGDVHVVIGRDYATTYTFRLGLTQP